jgi:hypothetical protein
MSYKDFTSKDGSYWDWYWTSGSGAHEFVPMRSVPHIICPKCLGSFVKVIEGMKVGWCSNCGKRGITIPEHILDIVWKDIQ